MTRAEILKQAEQIVCQDRESQYGSPEDNFAKIAEYWSIYLESKITAHDVAMMMIFLKTARISTGKYKDDNYIDLCGYAVCVGDTVYLIAYQYSECLKHNTRFDDYCCQGCEDECDSHEEYFIHINYDISLEWIARAMRDNRFGKTVFLTKEEALARLAELRGEEE